MAIARIRILVVELPRLVDDLVEQTIARQDDMAVVARVSSLDELSAAAAATSPDIVVAGVEDAALPRQCLDLMWERRDLSVLGIEAATGRAWLYELRLEHVEYDAIAPDDVVHSIRSAVERHSNV